MLVFQCQSGIGDVSWVYSKVANLLPQRQVGFKIAGSGLRRAEPFLSILPGIVNLGYGKEEARVCNWLPPDVDLATLPDGEYSITLNPYLEAGMRIENIFPHQKTQYHYKLDTEAHRPAAEAALAPVKGKRLIGFYCDSKHKDPRNRFWEPPVWTDFLSGVGERVPGASFLAIGASWDTRTVQSAVHLQQKGVDVHNLVGKLHIGATVEVLRRLHYFFVPNAGLAMLCDVIDTPCLMWYWAFQGITPWLDKFPNSYADPESIKSGRHVNVPLLSVKNSLDLFEKVGLKWLA